MGKLFNIKHAHPYTLNNEQLEHVFSEKDLGVIIDSELSFEEHLSEKIMKANKIVGLIRRSFSFLSPGSFLKLYMSLVRPNLEYAQVVWSPKLRKYVHMLENVQRRATRLIDGYRNLTYEERLRKLGLPTLEYRRLANDMIEVYKHLHVYDESTVCDKLTLRSRPNRKHDYQLLPNFARDGARGVQSKSFYYRCISSWNALPRDVVDSATVDIFN